MIGRDRRRGVGTKRYFIRRRLLRLDCRAGAAFTRRRAGGVDAANIAEEIESSGAAIVANCEAGSCVDHAPLEMAYQPGGRSRAGPEQSRSSGSRSSRFSMSSRESAAVRRRQVSHRRMDRSRECMRKNRARRDDVLCELSVYARRGAVARVSAGAVSARRLSLIRRNVAIANSGFLRAPPRARSGRRARHRPRRRSRNRAAIPRARRRARLRCGSSRPRSPTAAA